MKKRLLSILLALCMMIGLLPIITLTAQAAMLDYYEPSNYSVDIYSSYYTSDNPYYALYNGQCTWYCWGRAMEKCGVSLPSSSSADSWGNAQTWYDGAQRSIANGRTDFSVGTTPKANSIAVFEGVGSMTVDYGHVAFVEKVEGSTVYYSEGNYAPGDGNSYRYHEGTFDANDGRIYPDNTLWEQRVIGYIYLDLSNPSQPEPEPSDPSQGTYGDLTYKIENGEITITGCKSYTSPNSVVIPAKIDGIPVTSIGENAFQSNRLSSVDIPNSIISIGRGAFIDTDLTSVTIPGSVVSVGNGAFAACRSLTSVTISNGVAVIGDRMFYQCTALPSVTIPGSVTSIEHGAFAGCTGLTSVTIPKGITSIGTFAFGHCTNLTDVTIPNSVTNIGDYAFSDCDSLDLLRK